MSQAAPERRARIVHPHATGPNVVFEPVEDSADEVNLSMTQRHHSTDQQVLRSRLWAGNGGPVMHVRAKGSDA